ncbi:MAG: hypothetical protein V3W41_12410 [Planctomycetota bacterium]
MNLKLLIMALLLSAVALSTTLAQTSKPASKPTSQTSVEDAGETMKALRTAFEKKSMEVFGEFQKIRSTMSPEEMQAWVDKNRPKFAEVGVPLQKLILANPKHEQSQESLSWMMSRGQDDALGDWAVDQALAKYSDRKCAGDAFEVLQNDIRVKATKKLEQLAKSQNASQSVRALFALAGQLKARSKFVEAAPGFSGAQKKSIVKAFGQDELDAALKSDASKLVARSEATLLAVIAHPAAKSTKLNGQAIEALAQQQLDRMQSLTVGKMAPEITGADVDGAKFKLSDYRGKVVLLDFWGTW